MRNLRRRSAIAPRARNVGVDMMREIIMKESGCDQVDGQLV